MIRYQGENIDFSLEIEKLTGAQVKNWSPFAGVVVYFYTHTSFIAKFNSVTTDGYGKITLSSDKKTYTGWLLSDDTKQMSGALLLDIYVYNSTGVYKCIKSLTTGVQILYAPIKQET